MRGADLPLTASAAAEQAAPKIPEGTIFFARAWAQLYGGLGIVVLSVALLMGPGRGPAGWPGSGAEWEDLVTGTQIHAQRVLAVYLALALIGVPLLRLTGLEWNVSLLHTLAGISTYGFIASTPTWRGSRAGIPRPC